MADDAPLLLDVTRLIWRRWKGRHPTGIDRVCLAYLDHFGSRSQAVIQHDRFRGILARQASRRLFGLLADPPRDFRFKLIGGFLRHMHQFEEPSGGRLYLNVGHTGLNSPGYRSWCQGSAARPVYLVHDLIPISHPEFCRPGEPDKHRERMRTVLATAAGVIGNSRATLDALDAFAAQEEMPVPRQVVAWLGSDALAMSESAVPAERPTFVILGTIEGRKNHEMLLRIWARLVDSKGSAAPRLLIIGQRGWEADRVFQRLDRSDRLGDHVIELNRCSDAEINRHLAGARALLFPSIVEGFGLPLVEALGMGAPVIASDLPVFREIAGDGPTYLDPTDEPGWERAILDFAQEPSPRRRGQLDRIKTFRSPTWPEHFARVETFLQTIA